METQKIEENIKRVIIIILYGGMAILLAITIIQLAKLGVQAILK